MAVAYVAERASYQSAVAVLNHPAILTNPTLIAVGDHLIARFITTIGTRTVTSVTDPRGNVWAVDRAHVNTENNHWIGVLSCRVATAYQAADTVTFNLNTSGLAACVIDEASGLPASGWAVNVNSASPAIAGTAFASGDITTTQRNMLIYGMNGYNGSNTTITRTAEAATPTAWTALGVQSTPTTTRSIGGGYRIVTAPETVNYDGTIGVARSNSTIIVSYQADRVRYRNPMPPLIAQ